MRKFIAFFRRFRIFLVFIALQIVALGIYFSVMSFQQSVFLNSSSAVMGKIFTWKRNITKYYYLDEENKKLQSENVALHNELERVLKLLQIQNITIQDTVNKLFYERIPATVINSSYTFANNYFTIDAGTEKGVAKKMGVVSSDGVVGIVYDVTKKYALVKSILTNNINISAYVSDVNAHGLIKYDGENPRNVQLTGISNDIVLQKGSKIKTRGSGGYFPQGLIIGEIESIEPVEGKPMWNVNVTLNQDMRKLRYVYVIKNNFQDEAYSLEYEIEQLK